jgi:phosphoenolpyruvate carboxykinase (GTP)
MELRVHKDVKARKTPTGLIPLYEDLAKLFKSVLNKDYTKEDYIKQFTIRVPENLAKIERVIHFWQQEENAPKEIFDVLEQQKERLLEAQKKFGDYISPENFGVVE